MVIKRLSKSAYAKVATPRITNTRNPSPTDIIGTDQQLAIWNAMVDSDKNIIVDARAGTGKTFTCIHGLRLMEADAALPSTTAFVAFNKSIAEELRSKVPRNVKACTMHSLGNSMIRRAYGSSDEPVKLHRENNGKTYALLQEYLRTKKPPYRLANPVCRLVSLCKGRNLIPEQAIEPMLEEIAAWHDVTLYGRQSEVFDLVRVILKDSMEYDPEIGIDFDDMIWLPSVVPELITPDDVNDLLLVDEYQDTNACQQNLSLRLSKRLIVVGDPRQAIYGFRGADSQAMKNGAAELATRHEGLLTFPLTRTRRCPRLHVSLASQLVNDFEAMPEATLGSLNVARVNPEVLDSILDHNTLVLCRVNAPLIKTAFRLISKNVRCRVQGRDFSKGLLSLIRDIVYAATDPGSAGNIHTEKFLALLEAYREKETAKLIDSRFASIKLEALNDKCECLVNLAQGVANSDEIIFRIKTLFSQTDAEEESLATSKKRNFVLLSSVHRGKGMEAETVVILAPEKMPHPLAKQRWEIEQELNIAYVAFTRSTRDIWVCGELPSCFSVDHFFDSSATPHNIHEWWGLNYGDPPLRVPSQPVPLTTPSDPSRPKDRKDWHENFSTHRFRPEFCEARGETPKGVRYDIDPETGKLTEYDIATGRKAEDLNREANEAARLRQEKVSGGETRRLRKTKASGPLPKVRLEGGQGAQQSPLPKTPHRGRGENGSLHGEVPSRRTDSRPHGTGQKGKAEKAAKQKSVVTSSSQKKPLAKPVKRKTKNASKTTAKQTGRKTKQQASRKSVVAAKRPTGKRPTKKRRK